MQRVTITLTEALAAELDRFMTESGAENRSEAVRELLGRALAARSEAPPEAHCLAVMSCAVDQSIRNLAARVPQGRLERHDRHVAALSVPLDHSTSLEVSVLRGPVGEVSAEAERLFLERGILHGHLALIPVTDPATEGGPHHSHGAGDGHSHGPAHGHTHVRDHF